MIKEMKFLRSNYIEKILISASITGVHYLYKYFDLDLLVQLREIIVVGFGVSRDSLYERGIPENFQLLPVMVFWILIGILAYFLYYSLLVVYYNLEQLIVSELFFTKAKARVEDTRIKRALKRAYVHILVILVYLLSFLAVALLIFPVINYAWLELKIFIESYLEEVFSLSISLVVVFLIWYLIFSLFVFIFRKARDMVWVEELVEEHGEIHG
jgi:polyferredoxin